MLARHLRSPSVGVALAALTLAACSDAGVAPPPPPAATTPPAVVVPVVDSAVGRNVNPNAVPLTFSATIQYTSQQTTLAGYPVIFSATALYDAATQSAPTGTIVLVEGDCATGTALGAPQPVVGGGVKITVATVSFTAGTHPVSLCYTSTSPDWLDSERLLTALNFVRVNSFTVKRTIRSTGPSASPLQYGYDVEATLALMPPIGNTLVPTGKLRIVMGNSCAGTDVLLEGDAPSVTGILRTLDVGSYGVVSCYEGDDNFVPFALTSTIDIVAGSTTTTFTASPLYVAPKQLATFDAFVTTNGTTPAAGSVLFISGTDCSFGFLPIAQAAVDATGHAMTTFDPSVFGMGAQGFTACFTPSSTNYTKSQDDAVVVVKRVKVATEPHVTPSSVQYSDQTLFSVTLTAEDSALPSAATPVVGTVEFRVGSTPIASIPINVTSLPATVTKSTLFPVVLPPSNHTVTARFTPNDGNSEAGTAGSTTLTVTQEDATTTFGAATPTELAPTATFTAAVTVEETEPESDPTSAAPGRLDATTIQFFSITLEGQGSGATYNTICQGPSFAGSGYSATASFTCNLTPPAGGFTADIYLVRGYLNSTHFRGSIEDVLLVRDPSSGSASGAGRITLGGERVIFGFGYSAPKNGGTPRGSMLAMRRLASGATCRLRSTQMNLPAVNWDAAQSIGTVTLSGKGNYACTSAGGQTLASAGNLTITLYGEDRGNPGANLDRFWVTNSGASTIGGIANAFKMPTPGVTNAKTLDAGNILAPKPKK